jgi:DUF971 family protein
LIEQEVLMSMSSIPTKLRIVDDELEITWSDGQVRRYRFGELRANCPCATCREKRRGGEQPQSADSFQFSILSPQEAKPDRVTAMKPVGNYAYSVVFDDGHDTGIYTFDLLLELGRPCAPDA